ncbi:FMN-dependent dehydrogenase [Rhizoctonia solani]|uniref:FMN-dependent dehydrogenase n=1 Tax=Rhizoctonia solani TaxID=456999 RepID=A0A8H7M847_9AGAM|nr:FMN-dependent dehydrogenase [Rhizoctonia solani]
MLDHRYDTFLSINSQLRITYIFPALVSGKVYDVTEFISEHPGGSAVLLKHAGKDATAAYEMAHGPEIIEEGLPPEKKKGP